MYFYFSLVFQSYNICINELLLPADEEKKMNATYIISIARKLGCSIFLLPEDITVVFWDFFFRLLHSQLAFTNSCNFQLGFIIFLSFLLCDNTCYSLSGESKDDTYFNG